MVTREQSLKKFIEKADGVIAGNYLFASKKIEEMLMKRTLKYCALMLGDLLILLVGVMPALAKDRVKLKKTKVNMYVGG